MSETTTDAASDGSREPGCDIEYEAYWYERYMDLKEEYARAHKSLLEACEYAQRPNLCGDALQSTVNAWRRSVNLPSLEQSAVHPAPEMRPSVDLCRCVAGDRLLSKHGAVLVYLERVRPTPLGHRVMYPDGSKGTRTDEGWVLRNKPLPTDHDIVAILLPGDKRPIAWGPDGA